MVSTAPRGHPRGHHRHRLAQHRPHLLHRALPDPALPQLLLQGRPPQPARLGRGRSPFPQGDEERSPEPGQAPRQIPHRREVAQQLRPDLLAQLGAPLHQVRPQPRAVPQQHEYRVLRLQVPEDPGDHAQRQRKTLGVPRIVLRPRQGQQLAHAVRLLRVDRKGREAPIQQPIHDRPVGNLERYPDRTGIRPGLVQEPGKKSGDPSSPVGEGGRANERAGRVGQVNGVLPITQIDAGEPGDVMTHRRVPSSVELCWGFAGLPRRCRLLYLALGGADSLTGPPSRPSVGALVQARCSRAHGTPRCSRRIGHCAKQFVFAQMGAVKPIGTPTSGRHAGRRPAGCGGLLCRDGVNGWARHPGSQPYPSSPASRSNSAARLRIPWRMRAIRIPVAVGS